MPFVDMVREVDAPVVNVYRAYIEPDLVCQWLGPQALVMEELIGVPSRSAEI